MAENRSVPDGPRTDGERVLAPDLARGTMLLLIVLANTPWYFWGQEHGAATITPVDGSPLDQAVRFVLTTGVFLRVYPMFAFLFGYGIVQIIRRRTAAGHTEATARAMVQRRNVWLLVFGFAHAALLWFGDILGAYGLVGLLLVWLFLRRRDRTLLIASAVGVGALLVAVAVSLAGALTAGGGAPEAAEGGFNFMAWASGSVGESNPLAAVPGRLMAWPAVVLGQGLFMMGVPVAVLLGFWAARRRILEEPERHLPLLRATAVTGIALGWLVGAAEALATQLGAPEVWGSVLYTASLPSGLACGVGYVALFGLIGHRLRGRTSHGVLTTALAAVGKRSLSCYLAQSVLCAPVLAAWGLGFGSQFNSAAMAAYAAAVWLVIAVAAYAMERAGRGGPAEALLRRLAYRGLSSASPARRGATSPLS